MGVASGVDSFDGRSIAPIPQRIGVAKGAVAPAPSIPQAVGEPPLQKFNAAAATGATTKQAPDTRPQMSALKRTGTAVASFAGDRI